MKRFKKLVAGVLAATLVMGSTSAFLATEKSGSAGGSSDFEGNKPAEVFSVDLPTVASTSSAFDFILDPNGLIAETNGGNLGSGTTFVTSSLYFANTGSAYSNKTDTLVVTNKSSTDVTVTLNATVTVPASNSAVKFTTDSSFASDSSTSIYLALADSNNTDAITASGDAGKATLTATVASCAGYELTATNGSYAYTLQNGYNTFATYGFYLTGACNENANWTNYDTNAEATVNVTWTVKPVSTVAATTTVNNGTTAVTYSKANGLSVPYTVADGVSILNIKSGPSIDSCTVDIMSSCNTSNNTLAITGLWTGANNGSVRYVQITFSDNTSVTLTLTIGS